MPICEGCGSSFEDTFKFCPFCGRAKPEPKKINIEVDITRKPARDDCPICGDGTNVQKVSAIVAAGTSEANGSSTTIGNAMIVNSSSGKLVGESHSTGITHVRSIQQNKLAEILAKPNPPIKPSSSVWEPGWWTYGILIILILLLMGGFSESSSNMGTGETITFIIIGLVILGFAIWGITSMVNGLNNSEEKDQEAEKKYKSELTDYNDALKAWDALYYCHKHDIVFMLGNNDFAKKEDMWKKCIQWGKDKVASS